MEIKKVFKNEALVVVESAKKLRLKSGSPLPFPLNGLVCEQKNLTEFECYFSQSFTYSWPLTCFKYFDEFYHVVSS